MCVFGEKGIDVGLWAGAGPCGVVLGGRCWEEDRSRGGERDG